jgi:hypothetical protein
MSEPREIAGHVEEVVPGLYHWRVRNSAIGGGISSSHALVDEDGSVFVDPVRLADAALAELPSPHAILLTARCHQRSAWRYRAVFGADVWLPADAAAADEDPDHTYVEGDLLPGGLRAIRTPGPEWPHYSFLLERPPGVIFCSDLVLRYGRAGAGDDAAARLEFVPAQYHDDPATTRRSVQRLVDERFAVLCLAHGAPVTDDPKAALRELLASGR